MQRDRRVQPLYRSAKRSFEEFDTHGRWKRPSKAHAPSVFVESWRNRKARNSQRFQKKARMSGFHGTLSAIVELKLALQRTE